MTTRSMKDYVRRIITGYVRLAIRLRWPWGIALVLTMLQRLLCRRHQLMLRQELSPQGYETATTNITQGTLLSLTSSGSNVVAPATSGTSSNLVGVAGSDPLLELSDSGRQRGTVQVVVGGSTEALVSDINGPVHVGDKIAVSPVSGIGMKATVSSEIVGVAQDNLSSVPTVAKTFSSTDGSRRTAKVGLLPISVNVAYYSAPAAGGTESAFVPPAFQNLASAVAGKAVSPLRVVVGTLVLLLGFTVIAIMLYVSIRSNIISIGRNPLAADALRRGMVEVLIAAFSVAVVTGVVVVAVVSN